MALSKKDFEKKSEEKSKFPSSIWLNTDKKSKKSKFHTVYYVWSHYCAYNFVNIGFQPLKNTCNSDLLQLGGILSNSSKETKSYWTWRILRLLRSLFWEELQLALKTQFFPNFNSMQKITETFENLSVP